MHKLIGELDRLSSEIVAADESDLDQVARLIEHRSAMLASIAKCAPGSLTPSDLASLRAAAENGNAAIEKFVLLRRRMAVDWHRLNLTTDEEVADLLVHAAQMSGLLRVRFDRADAPT